jgi:hypothetical protein
MLKTAALTYAASKNGIRFRNQDYVGVGLRIGDRYEVRYFEGNTDFVEVFTLNEEYVTRAEDVRRMSAERRASFMAERARQEQAAAAITAGVQQHRQHLAATANALFGHEDTDWDGTADLEAVVNGTPQVIEHDNTDGLEPQAVGRPRRGRPSLPRATPQADEEDADDATARQTASERLAARFGAGLPGATALTITTETQEEQQ